MKKKTGLFKIIACILLAIMIITWIVPASYFTSGELSDLGMYRIGFFDFFQLLFGAFEFSYFLQLGVLILAIGAFYGVLVKTGKYRAIIDKIASKFKGKEIVYLLGVSFIIAAITAAFDYAAITFIFIPAIISVILAMKYDKITAFFATFGAYLVGIIGNVMSSNIVSTINGTLDSVELFDGVWYKLALFILSYAILALYLYKAKKSHNANAEENDMFIGEEKANKYPAWPIYLIFGILFVLMVLGCTHWSTTFNMTFFSDLHTKITSWTVGDDETALAAIILGNIAALGEWYYAEMSVMCLLAAVIVGAIYKLGFKNIFASMGEGMKKLIPVAGITMLSYAVVYFAGNTMFFPTIAGWILGATSKFNILLASITTVIGSALHVDMLYVANYVVAQVANGASNQVLVGLLTQSLYGITMFVVPSSAVLVLGLSYLGISYKEWIKKSWMTVVELLIAVLVIICVVALI